MGALALYVHKCGRSRFKRSKVWELSLETTKSVGAFTLSVQNVGAPALNIQKYVSSHSKQPEVWELSR